MFKYKNSFQIILLIIKTLNFIDNVVKKKPACGELVSVKIESTKFRAKILKNFEDLYAVFLLDLGSIKNVHINDIFELSNDLKSVSTCNYYCQ